MLLCDGNMPTKSDHDRFASNTTYPTGTHWLHGQMIASANSTAGCSSSHNKLLAAFKSWEISCRTPNYIQHMSLWAPKSELSNATFKRSPVRNTNRPAYSE